MTMQGAKVEGIEVELKVEVEVGKVDGTRRTKDCYQYDLWIDNKALGGNEVLALPNVKTATD
jgi:hypothetical protein